MVITVVHYSRLLEQHEVGLLENVWRQNAATARTVTLYLALGKCLPLDIIRHIASLQRRMGLVATKRPSNAGRGETNAYYVHEQEEQRSSHVSLM